MIVECELRKWDGFPTYRFEAERLGEDDYGTWLGVRAPTPFIGPKGPGEWKTSFVVLVPDDELWLASFYDEREPQNIHVYVDVTTRTEWPEPNVMRTIDLDLDVVRFHDGRMELQDEDEFEERRVRLGYPDDVVERARATARSLLRAIESHEEPFDTVGRSWLSKIE
jgi:hypothetical protein